MPFLDVLYIPLALATAPAWAFKKRDGWRERFGHAAAFPAASPARPRVLLHGVSVGEVSALRTLVPLLHESCEVVVSATTDTGLLRARDLYGESCGVVRYPLDFSRCVRRFLDNVRPDAVALVELEVWPNFIDACARREIPTCVINGRLSERSFKGYRLARGFFARRLNTLAFAAVQDEEYAVRFRALGMRTEKVHVTGSMKWDSATIADHVEGAEELAADMGIDRARPLVVAGSTAEDEEALLHASCPPGVQLLCAPRKPEHFPDAARAMPGCVQRTGARHAGPSDRFLLDTIGELRKAYALADVVVMGRSFGSLYGSDPVEPVALGKATLIGPRVSDFRQAVGALVEAGGLIQTDREGLGATLRELCANRARREEIVRAGRACVRSQQGASVRHAGLIAGLVKPTPRRSFAS
jgi:3-deoxy-D-manno-octulosonic-acid transferase